MRTLKPTLYINKVLWNIAWYVNIFTAIWTMIIAFNINGFTGLLFAIVLNIPAQLYYVYINISIIGLNNFSITLIVSWIFYCIVSCFILAEEK